MYAMFQGRELESDLPSVSNFEGILPQNSLTHGGKNYVNLTCPYVQDKYDDTPTELSPPGLIFERNKNSTLQWQGMNLKKI